MLARLVSHGGDFKAKSGLPFVDDQTKELCGFECIVMSAVCGGGIELDMSCLTCFGEHGLPKSEAR